MKRGFSSLPTLLIMWLLKRETSFSLLSQLTILFKNLFGLLYFNPWPGKGLLGHSYLRLVPAYVSAKKEENKERCVVKHPNSEVVWKQLWKLPVRVFYLSEPYYYVLFYSLKINNPSVILSRFYRSSKVPLECCSNRKITFWFIVFHIHMLFMEFTLITSASQRNGILINYLMFVLCNVMDASRDMWDAS